ncbi:MAG: hypothetical protein KDA44_14835 [Planctomycetales bacterium]|nr:hypothetical protein [Planctomycetales bacterium]
MKLHDLLAHHGVVANPFADEDAQTDPVFQSRCSSSTFHPNWDKVYGDPSAPATSIVFGEKGAGKTALRLQIAGQLKQHNKSHPDARLFVIEYDDFNPFLDRFADRLSSRKRRNAAKVLDEWKLWDHMDAILSLGVTAVVDRMLGASQPSGPAANELPADARSRLDRFQKRDLLLLSACYDNSLTETFQSRWYRLRKKLKYYPWQNWLIRLIGVATKGAVLGVVAYTKNYSWLMTPWPWLIIAVGWAPWLAQAWRWWMQAHGTAKNLRVVNRDVNPLRQVLMQFSGRDINGQPLPNKRRTDDRFELLNKFQGVLRALGFTGVVVLVDRVDEPHLMNGQLENMKALVWSMLDNKFLKQPGLGLKLLLPIELKQFVDREGRDFYQRARLDKQNMVPSLEWTGQSLYDLANARVAACGGEGQSPTLRDLFAPEVTDARLVDAFAQLRVPRHLFKFLYRLLVAHCQDHVDTDPVWTIPASTFDTQLAVYRREQHAVDQGLAS